MQYRYFAALGLLAAAALSAQENYTTWSNHKYIAANTYATGGGADIAGEVRNFPVLIRLDATNFSAGFAQSSGRGADLRFTKLGDATRLQHQVERWDSAGKKAEIWVKLDTVKANSMNAFRMHWGKPGAADSSKGPAVFETTQGFQAVWHLNENANDSARDATSNKFNGVATGSPGSLAGSVGLARSFDGFSQHFEVPNSASGALNFPLDGIYTISAWAFIDPNADDADRVIAAKHDDQFALKITTGVRWQFFEYDGNWQPVTSAYETGRWTHVTGVMNGRDTYIYVDGFEMANLLDCCNGGGSRNESANMFLGRAAESERRWWFGNLDEIRVSSVARDANWIRLEYENQRATQTMVFLSDSMPVALAGATPRSSAKALLAFSNAAGTLRFQLRAPGVARARLELIDLRGRTVWTHEAAAQSGSLQANWNGIEKNGRQSASGIYALRITLRDAQGKGLGTLEKKIPFAR